jgi:hypothetical protein
LTVYTVVVIIFLCISIIASVRVHGKAASKVASWILRLAMSLNAANAIWLLYWGGSQRDLAIGAIAILTAIAGLVSIVRTSRVPSPSR